MAEIVSNIIIETAQQADEARMKRLETAQLRYDGVWPNPLQRTPLDPGAKDNIKVNFARKTVDISAYYLFGRDVNFEVVEKAGKPDDEDADEDSPAEIWLEGCLDANDKMEFLLEFATGAGIAGDGFIRVLLPDTPGGFPRLVDLDPANVTAFWDPADYKRVLQYRIQWTGIDAESNRPITYRVLITRADDGVMWDIQEMESLGDNMHWTQTANLRWPYPWCPVFHTKNRTCPHQFYGTSDLEDDVLHLNEAVNFVLSNTNRILRAHAHPQSYIAGQGAGDVSRGIGDVLYLPNPDAKVGNVEMLSDLTSSQEQLQKLLEAYHELTSVPEVASGKVENIGQLSGLALQILYGPLVALTNVKRMLYGGMLKKLCKALLEMGGHAEGVTDIQIQWPNILPTDRAAEATTAISLEQAGVSKDTVLTELGYNPVDEAEKRDAEGASAAELAMKSFDKGEA